jgi:hypothetical protein
LREFFKALINYPRQARNEGNFKKQIPNLFWISKAGHKDLGASMMKISFMKLFKSRNLSILDYFI